MGAVSSALDPSRGGRGSVTVPAGYTTPSFPSLYIPTIHTTQQQRGVFLYEAEAIWHFTLYWTMALIGGTFLLCSLLASFTLFLSLTVFRAPSSSSSTSPQHSAPTFPRNNAASSPSTPLADLHSPRPPPMTDPVTPASTTTPLFFAPQHTPVWKRKAPPLWPVFLLPLIVSAIVALASLVTGTVIGFALAAVYSAGGFSMSTWVPFLWALIQVLVLVLSSYSTLTSIL